MELAKAEYFEAAKLGSMRILQHSALRFTGICFPLSGLLLDPFDQVSLSRRLRKLSAGTGDFTGALQPRKADNFISLLNPIGPLVFLRRGIYFSVFSCPAVHALCLTAFFLYQRRLVKAPVPI
jgi:hypothetical protein